MSAWRKAGFTFNNYMAIAAQTVRSALKTEFQTAQVLSRSKTDARYAKYEKGSAVSDSEPLKD
ncbi:LAFE_0E00870g1_1 [Lachancea fermentati]|uniref:LAFE_0E00870g1_1 n=1 Tax=Lachancea fermentati TaxID=4955 RepID=A0A1G4MC48_LACFM|nr:LAFE_0E00870g1_1 [Lachancea fermentati]